MHRLLKIAAESAKMLGLMFNVSKCKYFVDNRKCNSKLQLEGQKFEELENFKYLGTVFTKNYMKVKENSRQRVEESNKAAGAVINMMKGGYDSYEIARTVFTSRVRPVMMCELEVLPYSPFDFFLLDELQVKTGRSGLKYHECPPVAVLRELDWPSMTAVAGTRRFGFLIRVKNMEDSRLVRRALQVTLDVTSVVTPPLISIRSNNWLEHCGRIVDKTELRFEDRSVSPPYLDKAVTQTRLKNLFFCIEKGQNQPPEFS